MAKEEDVGVLVPTWRPHQASGGTLLEAASHRSGQVHTKLFSVTLKDCEPGAGWGRGLGTERGSQPKGSKGPTGEQSDTGEVKLPGGQIAGEQRRGKVRYPGCPDESIDDLKKNHELIQFTSCCLCIPVVILPIRRWKKWIYKLHNCNIKVPNTWILPKQDHGFPNSVSPEPAQ